MSFKLRQTLIAIKDSYPLSYGLFKNNDAFNTEDILKEGQLAYFDSYDEDNSIIVVRWFNAHGYSRYGYFYADSFIAANRNYSTSFSFMLK